MALRAESFWAMDAPLAGGRSGLSVCSCPRKYRAGQVQARAGRGKGGGGGRISPGYFRRVIGQDFGHNRLKDPRVCKANWLNDEYPPVFL